MDPVESTAMVVHSSSGLVVGGSMADLTEGEFEARLVALQTQQQRIAKVKQAVMVENQDYGTIPGTKRPTLLKGGAEKLCNLNGLVANIVTKLVAGNGYDEPTIRYDATCTLHVGSFEGPTVAVGHGTASSWERKYRYVSQKGSLVCPDCDRPGVVLTRRGVYWHPLDAQPDGGCGGNFAKDDPQLLILPGQKIEDPDPWDKANTLLKMAEKRAHVDATLRATATSGLFTQDAEDIEPPARLDAAVDDGEVAPPEGSMGWYKQQVKGIEVQIAEAAVDLGFTGRKPLDLQPAERVLLVKQARMKAE
jgi:hypothetical protein